MTHKRGKYLTAYPDVLASFDIEKNGPLDVSRLAAGSSRSLWWRCAQGPEHRWRTTVTSRTDGYGCPYCSGRYATSQTSLAALQPALATQWHPVLNGDMTPDLVRAQSNRRFFWLCPSAPDHVWRATPNDRVRYLGACPFCTGHRVCMSNCLATCRPDLAAQWHPAKNILTPYDLTPGSKKSVWWQCAISEHPDWKATPSNRQRSAQAQCPSCASHGFSPAKSGGLYLIAHDKKGLLQIGISNDLPRRLSEHMGRGWHVLDTSASDLPGSVVYETEQILLKALRQCATMADPGVYGPFSGYTEAFEATSLDVSSLESLALALDVKVPAPLSLLT
jgi:hypothetical protein